MKTGVIAPMLCALMCMVLLGGCGGAKYDDINENTEEFVTAVDAYAADLDKAESASDAAKAINNFAVELERLGPRMKKLQEKYPELRDSSNVPEELEPVQKASEAAAQKLVDAMMKAAAYMSDPDVQKAQQRVQAAMSGME